MYMNVASPSDAQNFSSMLKKGDWLVLYYADWCGHCKDMKPEWHKTVQNLKSSNKHINVGEVESTHIPNLVHKPAIAGYPTIKMYNHGKEVANFSDEQPRISQNFTKFAMDNSSKHHVLKPPVPIPHVPKPHVLKPPVPKPHVTKRHSTKHHSTKRHSTKRHSHSHKSRHTKSQSQKSIYKHMQKQEKATKDVFGELIKSFSRIGKEARTDAQLLKQAKEKL